MNIEISMNSNTIEITRKLIEVQNQLKMIETQIQLFRNDENCTDVYDVLFKELVEFEYILSKIMKVFDYLMRI
jgi:hypothetical protein